MKRRRPDDHRHPLQRRLLTVPTSAEEWNELLEANAYSNEEDWFQDLLFPQRVRRPLPSTHILSSTIALPDEATTEVPQDVPLLKEFYKAVGVEVAAKDDQQDETSDNEAKEDIDNHALSTLTLGQHQRYLQLTSSQQTERRKAHERKELQNLRKFVLAERSKYREAMEKFFSDHKERFLVGFRSTHHPASAFCQWSSSNQKAINERLKTETSMPLHFGKCRQILSFSAQTACSLDIESLNFQVVHQSQVAGMAASEFPLIHTSIPPPDDNRAPSFTWLIDDAKAHELAKEYKASIITTAETLETLLQLPGEYDSRWILYTTSLRQNASDDSRVTIVDTPIAQSLLPRMCFEKGLREGLQQLLQPHNQGLGDIKYTYTLWTLPSNNVTSRRKPVRVLVRAAVRLMDKEGIPISLRSHVDYFPERGVEEPTIYEKSLWILDQLLFHHKVKARFARIHAQSCQIMELEETSIAHAFAAAADESSNPLIHWQALIQVLQSIPTIDIPSSLLYLPSQDPQSSARSASVHAPIDGDARSTTVAVDLQPIMEQADAVVLNAEALRHCSPDWKWQVNERIPYTFPPRINGNTKK
jgi:hypothetical protein